MREICQSLSRSSARCCTCLQQGTLSLDDENWKVRLIEEEFMKRMWEMQQ